MDPNQNDQINQNPAVPSDDSTPGPDPVVTPQPEPTTEPIPEPISTPEPTPAPASDAGQGQVEEITPPPPMIEDHPQDEPPTGIDQGSAGDTNPAV